MPQPPQQQTTQGAIHRVPCPHCKKPNDFRALADPTATAGMAQQGGWGQQGLEVGAKVDCDHCGRFARVAAIEQVTVVKLVPM